MRALAAAGLLALCVLPLRAEEAPGISALARLPVKEVTVFKDGHALLLHEGRMLVRRTGDVQMDYLPTPVLGTFWVYGAQGGRRVASVTASQRRVQVRRTALTVPDLLAANPGAPVVLVEKGGKTIAGTVVGVPERSAAELEATEPAGAAPPVPQRAAFILIRTAAGVTTVPLERIQSVTFRREPRRTLAREEVRSLLTLKLDGPAGGNAPVGMMYVQKGIRWIPGYRIAVDGRGSARVRLQATLLNEITDLRDVTAHLVIGVPSFAFAETPDPMALQQSFAQLSPYFQPASRTGFALSNAIMSQTGGAARFGEARDGGAPGAGLPADLDTPDAAGQRSEDLFVFTVNHLTLRKGARMVVPIAEYTLPYRDVYALDVPAAPPADAQAAMSGDRGAEVARLLRAPTVQHILRLTNRDARPLTTAPALVVAGDRVLAQGMTTYTSPGGEMDLPLTTAVDVKVRRDERETARVPDAGEWRGTHYGRVDMAGKLTLTNQGDRPVTLEVTRNVFGVVDRAENDGTARMLNVLEDADEAGGGVRPAWWGWYNWPAWWSALNGLGRFRWEVTLAPGQSADLGYAWHYFW